RATEQGLKRLLAGGAFGWARGAGAWWHQRKIRWDDQRRLPLHGEFVGPLTIQQAGAAAGRGQGRGCSEQRRCANPGKRRAGEGAHQEISAELSAWLSLWFGRGFSRMNRDRTRMITTPIVIAASARLKIRNGRKLPKCRSA